MLTGVVILYISWSGMSMRVAMKAKASVKPWTLSELSSAKVTEFYRVLKVQYSTSQKNSINTSKVGLRTKIKRRRLKKLQKPRKKKRENKQSLKKPKKPGKNKSSVDGQTIATTRAKNAVQI